MRKKIAIYVRSTIPVLLLLLGAIFIIPTIVVSADQDGPYAYTVSDGNATITAYYGAGGAITIPSTLGGYPTVAIGDGAFSSYNGRLATSVTIPNSVISIGYGAFMGCLLATVNFGNNVTSIGLQAFYGCGGLTTVFIPSSVTSIGNYAFLECGTMTSINVDASNANYASISGILYNKNITTLIQCPQGKVGTVAIPNGVTRIGENAFRFDSVTSIIIPGSVTTIEEAGVDSPALTSITFLGLIAPTKIGQNWIYPGTQLEGHAYAASNFPAPGGYFYGLLMGRPISVPDAPTDISATPGNSQVALEWTAPVYNGGLAISDFRVYRSTSETGTYSLIASTPGLAFNDTGRTNGQTYWYKVSAINAIGQGANCSAVNATPFTLPKAPTGLTATPGNAQVYLAWSPPSSNGGAAIDYYIIYEDGNPLPLNPTGVTVVITGLTNGQAYSFNVAAHNLAGTGPQSSATSSTPRTVPIAPTGLTATPGNAQVFLAWSPPSSNGGVAIDYYVIFRSSIDVAHPTSTSYIDTGLTNGQTYSYFVEAHNSVGLGPQSNNTSATPSTVPGAPTNFKAVAGNGSIALTWNPPSNSGGFPVSNYYLSRHMENEYRYFFIGNTTGLSFTDSNVTIYGLTYYYSLYATTSIGASPSVNCSIVPKGTPPPPLDLTVVPVDSALVLSWSPPISNGGYPLTGYKIFRGVVNQPPTNIGSVGPSTNSYMDSNVSRGQTYYYYVVATNQKGNSQPSAQTSPVLVQSLLKMEIYSDTVARSLGYSVDFTVHATLAKGGLPVAGIFVMLSYSVDSGATWNGISSSTTGTDGNCSIEWLPTATGNFIVRASWAGDDNFLPASATTILAVTSSDQYYFTVQSNSTVSQLSFNSTSKQLNFTVSGPTGTLGYTKIMISKKLVADGASIKITMDGAQMNYNLTSTQNSWVLYFTYHHSSHRVVATMADTGPWIQFVQPFDGQALPSKTVFVEWNVTDNTTGVQAVWIWLDGVQQANVTVELNYTFTGLSEGDHVIALQAWDNLMNQKIASVTVKVDTIAPLIVITQPTLNQYLNVRNITLSFTVTDGDNGSGVAENWFAVDAIAHTSIGLNTTAIMRNLSNGAHVAYVKIIDNVGNVRIAQRNFTVDLVPPAVTASSPSGNAVDVSALITATFSEAMDVTSVEFTINGNTTVSPTSWSGNTATYIPSMALLYAKNYAVAISGKDLAGNDVTAGQNFIFATKCSISGTVKDSDGNPIVNATVKLIQDLNDVAQGRTNNNGLYNLVASMGSYNLTISASGKEEVTQALNVALGVTNNVSPITMYDLPIASAPMNLIALAGFENVTLTWDPPAYSNASTILGYMISYGITTESMTNHITWNQLIYVLEGLTKGQTYYFNVAAQNSAGWGINSTIVSATPFGLPTVPRNLTAKAGNGYVELNWIAPSYSEPGSVFFHLFRNGTMVWSGPLLTHNDSTVVNGVLYAYTVAAESLVGRGPNSSTVSARPVSPPILPGVPVGLQASAGDGHVTLNWTSPSQPGSSPITGYKVYRGTAAGSLSIIATVTGTTYIDVGLTNGQAYHYKVSAVSSVGESVLTEEVISTPAAPSSGGDTTLIIAIVAGVAIAGIGAALLYMRKRK